jgi:hypothetical protein
MGRISLKTILCAVFCAWGALGLGSCVDPVDLASFTEDDEVQEIIDKGAGTVNITLDSEAGLEAGNRKITGLDPGKYYMVEEWHENRTFLGVQFVSASGERSEDLSNIGAVSGGEITGLTNRYNYRVKAAGPLPGDVPYNVLTSGGGVQYAANTDGSITLPGPTDDSLIVYTLSPASYLSYDIAEISIFPASPTLPAKRTNNNILTLMGQETVIDYVFFQNTLGIMYNFYVLKVASGQGPVIPPTPGEAVITVTLSYTGDNPPQLTSTPITYPQSDNGIVPITVSNSTLYTGITWYIDGTQVGTGASFTLDKSLIQYKLVGRYTITVVASRDGIPYSAAIEVVVTPSP